MPTADDDLAGILDACRRLADLHYRMARALHTLGLLPEITRLRLTAEADRIDAVLDEARHPVAVRQT
ncbi:hypothetical protein Aph02nite_43920 [Actinoplanes philippinensis]|uniref:Uncharacterized protein n=1 Tax=Actinoplanes philippinensis TaxID=35752 RepID=A0A1I2IA46_9ACTN|nr:hypothetical protein [Actinoplanes philippinensis]GIE78442.1 hypothetical protein Aph02nite_43920 [Actinoplanes philippinensis]SFF39145.1 hypothetical protein SAMN05421541_109484 [Actinoplanes philippinensis]